MESHIIGDHILCTYILLQLLLYYIMTVFVFTVTRVNNQPDGLTTIATCEGWQAVYTCELNSDINSSDVQWYRFIRDTNTTVMVSPSGRDINFVTRTDGDTILTITNAQYSYNGFFWVKVESRTFCNASFTTTTSM